MARESSRRMEIFSLSVSFRFVSSTNKRFQFASKKSLLIFVRRRKNGQQSEITFPLMLKINKRSEFHPVT